MLLESQYQKHLIDEIKIRFPDAIVLKVDPTYIIGFPDLLVLYEDKWAALEVKRSAGAAHGNNQEYYVALTDDMSYGSFVYPENEKEILHELQQALRPDW